MRAVDKIDLDVVRFTTLDACTAAGIRQSTLDSWLNREPPVILLRKDERLVKALDQGYLLTLRRVFQIALTVGLIHHGVTAQRAGNLAAMFTDEEGKKPANRRRDPACATRRAGHLFASGDTILVANSDGKFDRIIAAVVNAPFSEVVRRHKTGAIVLDVPETVCRVLASLGLTDQCTVSAIEPATSYIPPHVPTARSVQIVS